MNYDKTLPEEALTSYRLNINKKLYTINREHITEFQEYYNALINDGIILQKTIEADDEGNTYTKYNTIDHGLQNLILTQRLLAQQIQERTKSN